MALIVGTNSYGSVVDANTYFSTSVAIADWEQFDTAAKERGLITVTGLLEQVHWSGTKEDSQQTLAFSRIGLISPEGTVLTAPQSLALIKKASYEYALAVLKDPSILNSTNVTGSNIKKVEAGSAKVTYFKPIAGTKYPLQVLSLIKDHIGGSRSSSSYVSGNTDNSSFLCPNSSRSRGFA